MSLHPQLRATPNLIYPLNAVIPPPSTVSLLLRKGYVVILPTFHHPLPRISSCALSKTKSKNQSYIDKYESKFSSGLSSRREEGTKKEKREREKRGVQSQQWDVVPGYDREQTIPKVFSHLLKATTTRRKSVSETLVSVYSSKYKRDVNLGSYDLSPPLPLSLTVHPFIRLKQVCVSEPIVLLHRRFSFLSISVLVMLYSHDDDQPRKTGNA